MDPDPNKQPFVILIADDEAMVRSVAVAMLNGQGYILLTATDGQDALQVLTDYHGTVDLALCDIRMPGPSGMALRNLILNDRPRTKVVLLSGDTSFSGIPSDVPTLSKPFTVGQLRHRVRELLEVE